MPYQQYNFKPQTFDAQKKRPDLRLLYISHSSYDKTWPSVLHSHPFTELFYVLNGTGTFQTETQTFCIAADDLILINPHVMHTEFSNGDAALEYVVLGFEGIAFETDGHAPITCLCKNVKTIRPACLFYTRSLIQELHDRKENYVEMSQNLLENLLYLIRREIRNRFLRSFLYYVPYVTLAVMTFPAMIYATDHLWSGIGALVVGVLVAWCSGNLFLVASSACAVVFLLELFL